MDHITELQSFETFALGWNAKYRFNKLIKGLHENPSCYDHSILSEIANLMFSAQQDLFIKSVEKGTRLYRARIVSEEDISDKSKGFKVGENSLPAGYNESNSRECPLLISPAGRNNVSGQSYLYAASNIETACSEVKPPIRSLISVAEFEVVEELNVLDLSSEKDLQNATREVSEMSLASFYTQLMFTFSQPVTNDGYVATQILSDYFRKYRIDGIKYKSFFNIFSFCILGTNSKCIEVPIILEKDNPIFNAFQPRYIPGFDQGRTREMVRKLGRLMGIRFDEGVYTRLTEDYGGHPFLIRQVCSAIAKKYPQRPVQIDRQKYIAVRDEFNRENDYFNMLLEVLKQFYADEYEMLNLLASGDLENFKYFADQDYSMVKHLIGYGIVRASDESYDFQIDALKEYLLRQQRRSAFIKTPKEKWAYTCTQRSALEIELRKMVKFILRIAYQSESLSKEAVVKKIYGSDARKYATYSYSDLFDSRKSNIYFKNLKDLINSNWDYFKDFWNKQEMFISAMDILNNEGRFDAHATIPEEDEIVLINAALNTVEKGLEKYKQSFS